MGWRPHGVHNASRQSVGAFDDLLAGDYTVVASGSVPAVGTLRITGPEDTVRYDLKVKQLL